MKLTHFIALAIMALTTTGCGSLRNSSDKKAATTIPATKVETVEVTPINDILATFDGEWSIVEVNGENVVINGENHPKLTFTIEQEKPGMISVIGFNGCNYLNGAWNIKGSKIVPAGEFISTLKACDDAPYEYAVNQALDQAESYQFTDPSNMVLLSSTAQPVMKLRRHNLAFLNGAWRVTEIEGAAISANVRIVIDVDEHKIHGNAGCNILNGDITINLDKRDGIEFKNLATSRMTCPDIATEQAFLLALESVDNAAKGSTPDTAVLKNAAGQTIISLKRLSAAEIADMDE
ncbi:MAG: META domain-containing protein [Duncaniella sp.]|nr:META domain-containing protein [Duncaniella sp.]